MMFAHGISIALLFALCGSLRERLNTLSLTRIGGLAGKVPFLAVTFGFAAFASIGLPGFANFASIGIQIGGIGALVPSRKGLLSKLGVRALIGGTIACILTATVIGMTL